MAFSLPPLPYSPDALAPHISAKTLEFHHGKHHKAYVDTLNKLVLGSKFAEMELEEVIQSTADDKDKTKKKIFNNAGQIWNHNFFWQCMTPTGGGSPEGDLADRIKQDFGGFERFKETFHETAVSQFGSGWTWLVLDNGRLDVISTSNAVPPLVLGLHALLTCDVWEHAYYLDYQNRRADFVAAFLDHVVNWNFAAQQMMLEGEGSHVAARNYQEATQRFASSGAANKRGRAAREALEGPEADALRAAEATGKAKSRGEDPALRRKRR